MLSCPHTERDLASSPWETKQTGAFPKMWKCFSNLTTWIHVKNAVARRADVIESGGRRWLVRSMAVAHVVKSTHRAPFVMLMTVLPKRQMTRLPLLPLLAVVMCADQHRKSVWRGVFFFFFLLSDLQLQTSAFLCNVRRHRLILRLTTGVYICHWWLPCAVTCCRHSTSGWLRGGVGWLVMTSSRTRLSLQRWRSHKGGGGSWVPALWLQKKPLTDWNRREWCRKVEREKHNMGDGGQMRVSVSLENMK